LLSRQGAGQYEHRVMTETTLTSVSVLS
jgi:hypothetical protein